MKRLGIFFLSMGLFFPLAAQIPLKEAVKAGIQKSLDLKNQRLSVEAQRFAAETADLQRRFTVDAGGSYRYQSQRMNIEIPVSEIGSNPNASDLSLSVGTHHSYDFNVQARQILFKGNILNNAVKAESIKIAVEQNAAALKKVEIAAAVKQSYFTYRLLQSKYQTLQVMMNRLEFHHNRLKSLFAEDLVRKSDLLETRNGLDEMRLRMEELNARMESERTRFRYLTGLDLADVEDDYHEADLTFERAADFFSSSHPVMLTLGDNLSLLDVRAQMIKGRGLPQIAAVTELHYGKPGIDFFQNRWSLYVVGGIQVSLPVFNWKKDSRELELLEINRRRLENERADFLEEGTNQLRRLFDDLESADRKIKIIRSLVETAREDNRLKEELLQEKQISNLEYLASVTAEEEYLSRLNEIRVQRDIIKLGIRSRIGWGVDGSSEETMGEKK